MADFKMLFAVLLIAIFAVYKAFTLYIMQFKFKTLISLKKTGFLFQQKTDFNILFFIVLYVAILQGFYLYVGITSAGGKFFSPFLSKYANFPAWLTFVIAKTCRFLLQLAGYAIYQRSPANLMMVGGGGVNIAWGCLGIGAISLWIGFIAAHRATVKYKLKWVCIGILLICLVNTARVITILLSLHYHWQYPMHFDAHTSFNVLSYAVIVLFMYLFIRNYKNSKQLN